jgi:alkyl hydroperoxide reductase subunit AhpC
MTHPHCSRVGFYFCGGLELLKIFPGGSLEMSLRINDVAPDFVAETTQGTIRFHEWIGDGWAVLFSHPKDFTPVCTTELGAVAALEKQFEQRGAKVVGLSVDPVANHSKWASDIKDVSGHVVNYPLIGDQDLKVAKLYDMLAADAGDSCEGRTPAQNAPVRTVFVIGPDKRIKLTLAYPMSTGRNFDEIIRVLDSIQLTAKHPVATPANWKQGEDVIITGAVSNEQADKIFPGYKTVNPYLRTVGQPQ